MLSKGINNNVLLKVNRASRIRPLIGLEFEEIMAGMFYGPAVKWP